MEVSWYRRALGTYITLVSVLTVNALCSVLGPLFMAIDTGSMHLRDKENIFECQYAVVHCMR
jgi:hypothetical protein